MAQEEMHEKTIIQKLDLDSYIHQFKQFLAREKPVAMMGDINQHHRYIKALSNVQFPLPKEVPNLDRELNLIKKQAVLSLDEIYAFVTMFSYFNTLKAVGFPEPLNAWISGIEIHDEIVEIIGYFTEEGDINPERDPELYKLERAIKQNKIDIKETLYKLAHSSRLRDYLVDTQVHFNGG